MRTQKAREDKLEEIRKIEEEEERKKEEENQAEQNPRPPSAGVVAKEGEEAVIALPPRDNIDTDFRPVLI